MKTEGVLLLLVVVVCGFVFAVQCLAQHLVCCCVGCVGGDSRRVTPGCPFPNPVAKSVGADGTAPGRVWESRLLPALITSNQMMVGGVLCVPVWHRHPTPFFLLFCLLVCFAMRVRGYVVSLM